MRFKVTKLELIARAQRLPSALSAPAHFPGLPCSKSRTPCQPQGHQSPPQWCSKAGRWLPSAWPASEPDPSAGPHPIPALGSSCLREVPKAQANVLCLPCSWWGGREMLPVSCLPSPQEALTAPGFLGRHSPMCCPDSTISIKMMLV